MNTPSILDTIISEEQQSTNQNKKNKKKLGEKNKESLENDPNRKNSEVKISYAEKDMKNLPIILDGERISYPENYERKEK